jgi:2-(acetamidomethylene)succinate hydrolase
MPSERRPERRRRPGAGVWLSTLERGAGPPWVLLHGITANACVWDPVADRLGDRFHVVAVDQRGHGQSDAPAHGYAAADFAADIRGLIEELGAGPAVVVGHSMGARNALVTASRHPDAVAACVAIDFAPAIEPSVFDALDQRIAAAPQVFADEEELSRYLASRYPMFPPDAITRRVTCGYRRRPEGGFAPLADPDAVSAAAKGLREPLEADILAIRAPTLVLRGGASALVSPAAFATFRVLRPDFVFAELAGLSHYVPEEAPERTVAQLEAFDATRSRDAGVMGRMR